MKTQRQVKPHCGLIYLITKAMLLAASILVCCSCHSQSIRLAVVVKEDKQEVKNSDLVRRVLRDLRVNHELLIENIHSTSLLANDYRASLALVQLGAPEKITNISTTSVNGISITQMGPVPDFDAFCDAIDYGKIVEKNRNNRYVKISINPEELQESKLKARARKLSRGHLLDGLFDHEEESDSHKKRFGFHNHRFSNKSSEISELEVPNEILSGDNVEIEMAGMSYAGLVEEDARNDLARVSITDMKSLIKEVSDRKLKSELRRVDKLSLLVPLYQLRLISRADSEVYQERVWKDASGRFSITATFTAIQEGKVKLRKQDNQTISIALNKLSEADQAYVTAIKEGKGEPTSENPFLAADNSANTKRKLKEAGKRLEVDYSQVKEFDSSNFDNWHFNPPKISIQRRKEVAKEVELTDFPDSERFAESVPILDVAPDGSRAIVVRKDQAFGSDFDYHVQMVDTVHGRISNLVKLPKKSVVMDTLPEKGLVLIRPDKFGLDTNTRIFVQRLTSKGLVPVLDWVPFGRIKGIENRSSLKGVENAWFLTGNRVLTTTPFGRKGTIWKIGTKAIAEFEFEAEVNSNIDVVVGPNRRMIALCTSGGISIIDSQEGKLVGVIQDRNNNPFRYIDETEQVAFSLDMQRLAVIRNDALATFDLASGELISEIWHPEIDFRADLMWVDDLVLVNGKFLFDPARRILLWKYKNGIGFQDGRMNFKASRLWYVRKSGGSLSAYLGSIPTPDRRVTKLIESLDRSESLLLAEPGDEISIRIDVEPQYGSEKNVRNAIAENLSAAGYVVVEHDTPLVAVATCKTLTRQQVRINLSKSYFDPDDWDIITKSIIPKAAGVSIERNEEEIWKSGYVSSLSHIIILNDGETLDDALKRLTSVNIESVLNASFPTHIAKVGETGKDNAYGESYLD